MFVQSAGFRLINLLISNSTSYRIRARRFVAQVSTREETALEELGVRMRDRTGSHPNSTVVREGRVISTRWGDPLRSSFCLLLAHASSLLYIFSCNYREHLFAQ